MCIVIGVEDEDYGGDSASMGHGMFPEDRGLKSKRIDGRGIRNVLRGMQDGVNGVALRLLVDGLIDG